MNNNELAIVNEEARNVEHMKLTRLEDSLFSKELAPHYMNLASKLSSSEMVPKCFRGKPQDLFIAWAMGYQFGMSPEQSMQCIAVINGRPSMWGDDMLALCMAHKDFEDIEEAPIRNKDDVIIGFVCTIKRKGRKPKINEFTLDMAKKAGLLSKVGPWTQYPERMLKLRARGFCLRDAFPDALKGMKSREEVEDYIDVEFKSVSDNMSRTEFLKKDLLTKKESHVEINCEAAGNVPPMENQPNTENAIQDSMSQGMVNNGEFQTQETNKSIQIASVSLEEILLINKLLHEKGFTEERLKKAFNYYEVNNIEEMSADAATHFINKLMKNRKDYD